MSDAVNERVFLRLMAGGLLDRGSITALVGFYHLIAFAANTFKVPLEPYGARFPPR